jgi:hypothetical protein
MLTNFTEADTDGKLVLIRAYLALPEEKKKAYRAKHKMSSSLIQYYKKKLHLDGNGAGP